MSRSSAFVALLFAGAVSFSAATASADSPGTATRIHPGDQLSVQVFGDQTLSQTVIVLGDGTVDYPLIGRVRVAGKTPDQAAAAFVTHLRQFVRNPTVNVLIAQLGLPDVLVLGDVKTPGKYQLRSDAKLTDAIAAAGGLVNTNGAFPDARVADANGNVQKVSLQDLLQRGNTALDISLGEGSVVYVPGRVPLIVEVAGAVDHPGDVQVNEGDHLSVAIAKAGNSQNAQADLNHIRVERTDASGKQTTMEVNLYDAFNKGQWQTDVALQKGDVIYVPQAAKHSDFFGGLGSGLLFLLTHLIP
ncbi:MAG: polysaccharide biosynthesis/export family protein [Candidatus Cybelea sp.]